MRPLLDRIELWWYARQAGRTQPIWPVALMLLGFVLLTVGTVRTATSLRVRDQIHDDIRHLSDEVVDLEAAASLQIGGNELTANDGYFDGAIPPGRVPGPILEELFAELSRAGVSAYDYRVREPLPTLNTQANAGEDEFGDDYDDEDEFADDQIWEDEDWESEFDEGTDDPFASSANSNAVEVTPGLQLLQWTVELSVRSTYAGILQFVSGLATAERHWRVSHLEITKMSPSLEASFVLKTFTRPDGAEESFEIMGPVPFNNPFVAENRNRGSGRPLPPRPVLRALLSGSQPRAWLGDRIVTTGETVGQWTVEEIDEEGIWVRHLSGRRSRLTVEG